MKRFPYLLLFSLLIASCSNAGTTTPTQPAPTIAPTYEPSVPSLLTGLPSNKPADTPPEFKSGFGDKVTGISEADLNALKAWEIYQKVYRDEVGPKSWPSEEAFTKDMLAFITGKSDLEVKVNQDAETGKILVAVIKKDGDQQSAYWDFDNGVVANTNPMSLRAESESGLVSCPNGTTCEFRYNAVDKHWYMFAVDAKGEAVSWFATNGATIDNQADHWVEVEKAITDVPAYLESVKVKAMKEEGVSTFAEYVIKKVGVIEDGDEVNRGRLSRGYPGMTRIMNYVYVMDEAWVDTRTMPVLEKYGEEVKVLVVAAEREDEEPMMILCGVKKAGVETSLCPMIYDRNLNGKSLTGDDLRGLVGRKVLVRGVQGSAGSEEYFKESWDTLLEGTVDDSKATGWQVTKPSWDKKVAEGLGPDARDLLAQFLSDLEYYPRNVGGGANWRSIFVGKKKVITPENMLNLNEMFDHFLGYQVPVLADTLFQADVSMQDASIGK